MFTIVSDRIGEGTFSHSEIEEQLQDLGWGIPERQLRVCACGDVISILVESGEVIAVENGHQDHKPW